MRNGAVVYLKPAHVERPYGSAEPPGARSLGLGELRNRAGFTIEALPELRVGGQGAGQDLDRNGAVESRVARSVDLAHSARPERREDFVGAETAPDSRARTGCPIIAGAVVTPLKIGSQVVCGRSAMCGWARLPARPGHHPCARPASGATVGPAFVLGSSTMNEAPVPGPSL